VDGVREPIGQGIKSKIPTYHFFKRIGYIPREGVGLYLCDRTVAFEIQDAAHLAGATAILLKMLSKLLCVSCDSGI
jgi:hypothetical protein